MRSLAGRIAGRKHVRRVTAGTGVPLEDYPGARHCPINPAAWRRSRPTNDRRGKLARRVAAPSRKSPHGWVDQLGVKRHSAERCARQLLCLHQERRSIRMLNERGRTSLRNTDNTVDHCDQSRRSAPPERPAARGGSSPVQHTPSKAKPTGQHAGPEKNSFPDSACSTSGRRTKSPRATGGDWRGAPGGEESLAGASTPGRNSGDTGGLVRLGQHPGAGVVGEPAAHDQCNAKACRSHPATTVERKVHSPNRPAHLTAFLVEERSA